MTTDIAELALIKGQKVEAPYYLAECTECGKMYSSSKLIEARNYFDGDADFYCPHCNADDADIADLGSGEQPAVMAWNYQQARIDALVEALEKAQQRIAELENNEIQEEGNQFLVVRHPGKVPVIKHPVGELEDYLRQIFKADPLATIDIVTHRYYGVGGQFVEDADEYLHEMSIKVEAE
ncbi:TPA: hypothetical protein ACXRXO_005186 [Klebsiella pneumoniae]